MAFLKAKGVPAEGIKVHYMGDTEPLAGNDTQQGRAANRRVEVKIIL